MKLDRVGEKYITSEGYIVEVVEYVNSKNCCIKFESGYIVNNIYFSQLKRGNIKNPYHPSIYNIGFLGVGKHVVSKDRIHTKCYRAWRRIFDKCFSEIFHKLHPTYRNCTISKEWYNFQIFGDWFENNFKPYMEDWHLDKDLLIKGNKHYSSETCCIIPQEINKIFVKQPTNIYIYSLPVNISMTKSLKKYEVKCEKSGKRGQSRTCETIEEAFKIHKESKEKHLKRIADKWKGKISEKVYETMYNYQVEITD